MCVTYCHRRDVLYWNHDPCSFEFCPLVAEVPQGCAACMHRQGELCGLTRAPLPPEKGCCHWNVEPVRAEQTVTRQMLEPLVAPGPETVIELLEVLEVPYRLEGDEPRVDPERLGLPETYGLGTHEVDFGDEEMDWSEWEATWLAEEPECAP